MSLTELALMLFVALILFGPEDLPVIARTLGKIVFQIRKYTNEITREFQDAIETPGKVINDALNDSPSQTKTLSDRKEESEELLTYENGPQEKAKNKTGDANPLADLPSDIVSYRKDPQAGE
ncbi:MAG: TatA [Peptococcaceae bacterium]|nr:TatA [Peptococcaceae bacterium]